MQVYKVENADNEKFIYIAATGLYEIVKHEKTIIAAAMSYKADEVENSFNQLVSDAIDNYAAFIAKVTDDMMYIDVTTNFAEFFNVILDIKKAELENSNAEAAAAVVVASAEAPGPSDQPLAKGSEKKNSKPANRR